MSLYGRTCRSALIAVFAAFLCLPGARASAGIEAEKEMLAHGQYEQAVSQLEKALAKEPANPDVLAALLDAKIAKGNYWDALEQGEDFIKRSPSPAVTERTAEAAYQIGAYDRTAVLLEKVTTPRGGWLRGLLAERKGDKEAARAAFQQVTAILDRRASATPDDLGLAASALAKLGKYKDANDVFREAVKTDSKNALLKAEWGELMAEKHNPADAEGLFKEALQVNPQEVRALLGMAELASGRSDGQMFEWVHRAFAVNKHLAEAHVLMARAALEEDQYDTAARELNDADTVNRGMLEAWSLRAVLSYLRDDPKDQETWVTHILKENPHYGQVFDDLGDFSAQKRQLQAAVEFYRRAVDLDPDLDDARANLGINLFRLGQEQEARKILEDAYSRDPYNIWTVNTLRLMDSFSRFDTFETAHFAVKLSKKEAEILRPYVADLLEKTYESLSARYGFVPPQKVTFEMYPDHEDFAVRTLGMPGLGALGATFGNVVAMDSPSARPVGAFHWGSTLFHEAAHVMSLGLSDERVPRWFTEGLSVYEETNAHPGWGDPMDPETVRALQQKKLLPIQDLNGAFVHPSWPGAVPFAYFQAGLMCQYIVKQYGFPKILVMLRSYGQGHDDADTVKAALGKTLPEFDSEFLKFAKEQTYGFAEAVDFKWASPDRQPAEFRDEVQRNPRNFFARLYLAEQLLKDSKFGDAVTQAQAAKELFPLFVSKGSPYEILADAYDRMGQKDKAVAELRLWRERKGRDPEMFKRLARLQQELGRTDDAINTFEEALNVSMFDLEIHNRLGELYLDRNNPQAAVREYQAVLALGPPDKAAAHYQLANAYRALSDDRKARSEVLAALEIAPGFRPAQKLLLELTGK